MVRQYSRGSISSCADNRRFCPHSEFLPKIGVLAFLLTLFLPSLSLAATYTVSLFPSYQTFPTLEAAEQALRAYSSTAALLQFERIEGETATQRFYRYSVPEIEPNPSRWSDCANVAGEYDAPQAVCDARKQFISWPNPLTFVETIPQGSLGNGEGQRGVCQDLIRASKSVLAYVKYMRTCPAGYQFKNAVAVWTCGFNMPSQGAGPNLSCGGTLTARITETITDGTNPEKEPNCSKGNKGVGNPCNPVTGNKFETEVDIAATAAHIPELRRNYSSRRVHRGLLGDKWRLPFENRLWVLPGSPARIKAIRPDGRGLTFTQINGVWTPDPDVADRLISTASGWTYATPDGAAEHYDSSGRLLSLADRSGVTQNLGYDSKGKLESVSGPFGHRLVFSYDASRRIAEVADSIGRITRYDYDANNNLVRVGYPDGSAKHYHYEDASFPSHFTGISYEDTSGAVTRFSTYGYDTSGRAVSTGHAGGQENFTIDFDSATQSTTTDATNTKEVLTFALNLGVRNVTSKKNLTDNKILNQTFDPNNNLTCRQDEEGRVTTFTYTATNQKVSETAGRTGTCASPVTTSATRTTTFEYLGPNLDLPTVIESPSVAGSSLRKRTEIGYDATLKVPRTITQKGYTPAGVAVSRTLTLDYNTYGQVTSIDGPRTDVADITTLEYYECATGRECGQLKSVTNALGHKTTYDVYDTNGRLIELTDPNGLKTFYGYDPRGRVLSVAVKAPDGTTHLTGYQYDAAGNVTEVKTPDGKVLTSTFDAAQYLRTVTDNLGNRVEYSYDLKGNRTATRTYDPQGTLVRSLELAFDARNRVSEINDGGSITKQVFDAIGNLTRVTDPNTVAANGSASTVNEYDALNRLFKTTDRLSGISQYGYDTGDRVKQVTAPNTATTGYEVDDLGRVLKETSPDRGVLSYGYDQAGNVTSLLDARGITVSYTYDALNRLTNADFPGTEEDVAYTYDTVPGCTHGIGRLCTVSDAAGASTYGYDGLGNLTTHTRTELGVSFTTAYGYDPLNRVASITYPDGRKVDYTRNTLGQVTGVTLTQGGATQSLASQLTYRADGLLTNLTYGNGVAESRLYSLAGRLESWTVGSETRGFIYDANGNLKDKTGAAVASFSYDALDRLKEESLGSFAQSFTYDPNGNRKSDGLGSYDYLARSNRLSTAPSGSITLDPAGNLTTLGARSFGYYANGQLRDITEAGTPIAAYAYNSERLRTRKTIGTDTTVYHYDLTGNLLMETDAAGTPRRAYVWLNGRPLAQLDSTGIVYLHTDHLDTPRLATNTQGTVVWRWEGAAFGDTAPDEDADGDGTATTINLRFPGQYYDAESGLHYNWNRYYDPRIGRYITADPIGVGEHAELWMIALRSGFIDPSLLELNPYAYVDSNPLRWTDLLGLAKSGQTVEVPGTNSTVRIDPPHVPGQQRHAHVCQKGCDEIVVNADGTGSHGTDPKKIKNRKVLKYLASKGIRVALKCGAPVFFAYDWYDQGFGHAVDELTWPVSETWTE